jgi:hypothetical protein
MCLAQAVGVDAAQATSVMDMNTPPSDETIKEVSFTAHSCSHPFDLQVAPSTKNHGMSTKLSVAPFYNVSS